MARDRVAKLETKRIEISDGDWIQVKTRLNAGDQRKHDALGIVPIFIDGALHDRIDWSMYEFERADLWITDWSLTTKSSDDKVVPIPKTIDGLRALDDETFNEINAVLYQHILQIITAKKARAPKEVSPASPSSEAQTSQS